MAPRRLSCQISANQREAEKSVNVNKHRKTRDRRLSCQISANQREAEKSVNVNKHRKTRDRDNDVITIHFFDADVQTP